MKLGLLADCHIWNHKRFGGPVEAGLNRRGCQTVQALARACRRAKQEGCESLAILGDLYDGVNPPPQLQRAVQLALAEGPPAVILMGNHDQVSTAAGDHSLGPLDPVAPVVEKPSVISTTGADLLAVPFRPGRAEEWLPAAIKELNLKSTHDRERVLLLHLGLSTPETEAFLKDAPDQVSIELVRQLCERHYISGAFAGNWHGFKLWRGDGMPGKRPAICQVGTLNPTGFDNPGLWGHGNLVVWDTETYRVDPITIPGPRFMVLKSSQAVGDWRVALSLREKDPAWALYLRVDTSEEHAAGERAWLTDLIQRGMVCDGEVNVDEKEARVAARTAATMARSASTLQEALEAYVREMALAENVDRAVVLETAQRYLAQGD